MSEFDKLLVFLRDRDIDYVLKDCYYRGTGVTYREVYFELHEAVQNRKGGLLTVFYRGEQVGQELTADEAAQIWRRNCVNQ